MPAFHHSYCFVVTHFSVIEDTILYRQVSVICRVRKLLRLGIYSPNDPHNSQSGVCAKYSIIYLQLVQCFRTTLAHVYTYTYKYVYNQISQSIVILFVFNIFFVFYCHDISVTDKVMFSLCFTEQIYISFIFRLVPSVFLV